MRKCSGVLAGALLFGGPVGAAASVGFNEDVRPILSKNCIGCHGPDPEHREKGLRLDTFEGATALREGKQAVVPGQPGKGQLMARVTTTDPDEIMPPPDSGHALKPSEIEILRRWIAGGAEYEQHWALVPPKWVKPVPVKSAVMLRNPIDQFVVTALQERGLSLSPEADPAVLIRRVALDLTGLPPDEAIVKRYLADPTEANYKWAVDQLLASPAFGEHWAAMWLDLARYADTMGYASDNARTIWPWRDWVIRSYNQNQPFDEFTRDQLAGDLLPHATDEQVLATAFHRNTLNNTEGGTVDEEFRVAAVKDRIGNTVNVWMGYTMRCAECHTHKYDPISQEEYYRFFAFFNQTADRDTSNDAPVRQFIPPGKVDRVREIDAEIASLQKEMKDNPELIEAEMTPMQPAGASADGGAVLKILEDHAIEATGKVANYERYRVNFVVGAGTWTGFQLELLPNADGKVGRHANGSVVVSQVILKQNEKIIPWAKAVANHTQPSHDVAFIIREQPDERGWAVGGGGLGKRNFAILQPKAELVTADGDELVFEVVQQSKWAQVNPAKIRFSATGESNPVQRYVDANAKSIPGRIAALEKEKKGLLIPTPIMEELASDKQRKTHLLIKGNYLLKDKELEAGVPAALFPFPEGLPQNRLGVAKWLTDSGNPLTARVIVNRYWAQLFGMGLVETEEDFGTQGVMPTHPELLDWLALVFRGSGWDRKALLKTLVTSSTYRQSAVVTEEKLAKDPRNQWLSRGPRVRLSAEVLRDQALAVGGLLSSKMYGPPVYPPNPIKSYRSAFSGAMQWKVSPGEDRYRRALYTYLKRTQPYPLFETFDMNTREVCSLRRVRTNTPLQSFMTLNDPVFVEAAQALARRMMEEGGETAEQRIAFGMRAVLLREATPEELQHLYKVYNSELKHFSVHPKEAVELATKPLGPLSDGALAPQAATYTVIANILLNLDAFLNKG